ncbi:MAG: molybdenum cofactor guanylyltransferase [Parvibaculaceae bacterium]|nr:molybdenum cofactor guanylyltransferase [Parvibaculaceae bacterium]
MGVVKGYGMSRTGVILAGGMGTRLAKPPVDDFPSSPTTPKPWEMLGEKTLLQHAYDRLAPQVDEVVFSVAESFDEPTLLGCKVIPDIKVDLLETDTTSRRPGRKAGGPLVAIASVLQCMHEQGEPEGRTGQNEIVTVPVDMPFLPQNLVAQLAQVSRAPGQPCYAFCGDRDYPTCAIWPIALAPQLVDWVVAQDMRAIYKVLRRLGAIKVNFDKTQSEAFLNINSPQDLENAKTLMATGFGAI